MFLLSNGVSGYGCCFEGWQASRSKIRNEREPALLSFFKDHGIYNCCSPGKNGTAEIGRSLKKARTFLDFGLTEEFIGDAILSVYGAPLRNPMHADVRELNLKCGDTP